jgi:hypothetical protein
LGVDLGSASLLAENPRIFASPAREDPIDLPLLSRTSGMNSGRRKPKAPIFGGFPKDH